MTREHTIASVVACEILDCPINPTVEVEAWLASGVRARVAVPSGASASEREAVELRDSDAGRYLGKGVCTAVESLNGEIARAVLVRDASARAEIDTTLIELDGTENRSRLGPSARYPGSRAFASVCGGAHR